MISKWKNMKDVKNKKVVNYKTNRGAGEMAALAGTATVTWLSLDPGQPASTGIKAMYHHTSFKILNSYNLKTCKKNATVLKLKNVSEDWGVAKW